MPLLPRGSSDSAVQQLHYQILMLGSTVHYVARPGRGGDNETEEGGEGEEYLPLGVIEVKGFLAGVLPFMNNASKCHCQFLNSIFPGLWTRWPPLRGRSGCFNCKPQRCGLSGVLSIGADNTFVVLRTLELPVGVDREMPLVDLRWVNVRNLVELAGLVSSGPSSSRRSWLGLGSIVGGSCPDATSPSGAAFCQS